MNHIPLLPYPRFLKRRPGFYVVPIHAVLHLEAGLNRCSDLLPIAERIQSVMANAGVELELVTGPPAHPRLALRGIQSDAAPDHAEGYLLDISAKGVVLHYRQAGGLRAGVATLRQLVREYGRRLPRLSIRDYPDFPRRGVMLDISRGRVPNLETLLGLVEQLADFKINEFQLYTEHTFAYRNYEPVWRDWGALNGEEILLLDERCRQLGIDLVPNQNSFGHLRHWLEYPPLRKLAETRKPYEGGDGTFLRFPATLAPNHPGTLPFLRGLYDELLPHFTSRRFNVGCDETWDLGRGQSRRECDARGQGAVYVDFLKRIQREVVARGRQMMFWGDIILRHPELLKDLPREMIALNWGYEADHPFDSQCARFADSNLPFYVCPGTATWTTMIGRHDVALLNLRSAAVSGLKHGAMGYLNTDWGDGGHPQPLAVSYIPYLAGAALSWFAAGFQEELLAPVLDRDVFHDSAGQMAAAALGLGFAHLKFQYTEPNVTPFGAVIAAPRPGSRELFCRDGLKYYARIPEVNIRAALNEVARHAMTVAASQPKTAAGTTLMIELSLAAQMAVESCQIMLWQQALAKGRNDEARKMAKRGVRALNVVEDHFNKLWPSRNKGTPIKSTPFLQWRIKDYQSGRLVFPPELARKGRPKSYAAE